MGVGIIFVALVLGSAIVFGPGLVAAVVAHRKGYRPWFWILSLGLVGMLVMLLIPGLGEAATPEQRERWESRADRMGGLLSGFTFLSMLGLPLLAMMFFVGIRTTGPVMKPVAFPAPPPIVVEEEVMTPIETSLETIEPQPAQKQE